jgi:hypothetical protein
MTAVILARDLGTRISKKTHPKPKPKPLIDIDGGAILLYIMKKN